MRYNRLQVPVLVPVVLSAVCDVIVRFVEIPSGILHSVGGNYDGTL